MDRTSTTPAQDGSERFNVGDVAVLRFPAQASMSDGNILRGYRYQREQPADEELQTPLLCIPSELGTTREFHAFCLDLVVMDGAPRRIYTFGMRGRGRSDANGGASSSTMSDSDDLISICDALGLHHSDVLVTGRSALSVFLTGSKRPTLFRKIILNDAAPEFDGVGIARHNALMQRVASPGDWKQAIATLRELKGEQFPNFGDNEWANMARMQWRDDNGRPLPDHHPSIVRLSNAVDYDSKQPDLWMDFKLFKRCPILLLHGENSQLVTPEIARAMEEVHPDLTIYEVEGQGHDPILHMEGIPERVQRFLSTAT